MALQAPSGPHVSIDSATSMGTVRLTVSDITRSRSFYERAIGLRAHDRDDGTVALGPDAANPLLELTANSAALPLDRHATGLYHLAILLPSRLDLALALARLAAARWPLDGASDHMVSEALYLSDPDGNGIEIYRDRPRDEWRRRGDQIEMATLPLDIENLAGELESASGPQPEAPTGTKIGHVHLQVASIEDAEAFYSGVLGFDVVVRGYPGALFVSAGGYHHHLGLNIWHSAGASAPAEGSVGLRSFEVVLPSQAELERVLERVRQAELPTHATAAGTVVRDPSGNAVVLRA